VYLNTFSKHFVGATYQTVKNRTLFLYLTKYLNTKINTDIWHFIQVPFYEYSLQHWL